MRTQEALIIESMFKIPNKEGREVPFVLNPAQRRLDEELSGRDIIPKARQEGVSSYFLARYTAACLIRSNVRAVLISHDIPSTQRLLDRCKFFLDHMDPKPIIQNMSANEITFPKTGSMFYIGTAGSKKFGRGDTITHLHCSEYAYWSNAKDLMNGLMDAVPYSGEVAIESTGNGMGNDYYNRVMRAWEGRSRFKCHFLDWAMFPEYTLALTPEEQERVMATLSRDLEEINSDGETLCQTHGLTPGQLAWRRMKLEEKDYDIKNFKQEYPLTIDECFQAAGNSIFYRVKYKPTKAWTDHGNHLWVLDGHPRSGFHYSIGADPSGGTGQDNASAQVFCTETREQVAEYAHDKIEPDVFGDKLFELGKWFNWGYITVESNNHGPVTLGRLRDLKYPEMCLYIPRVAGTNQFEDKSLMKMGFRTTQRSKPIIIGYLRTSLAKDLVIHSPLLKGELDTFIEHENGKLAASDGNKDDRVIAAALANFGFENAGMFAGNGLANPETPIDPAFVPFTLDNILRELRLRGGGEFPIRQGIIGDHHEDTSSQ